jgi:hypothetical protein
MAHDPEHAERRAEGQRKGGEARSAARRAARAWAMLGEQVEAGDLPAILRSCMFAVRQGAMTPGEATAIATLAKASVSITNEVELEARIAALEEGAALAQPTSNIRRIS